MEISGVWQYDIVNDTVQLHMPVSHMYFIVLFIVKHYIKESYWVKFVCITCKKNCVQHENAS